MSASILQKILELHTITKNDSGDCLLYVDYNVLHEGPFYAFDGLAKERREVLRPAQTLSFSDHYAPTTGREQGTAGIADGDVRNMIVRLEENARRTGIVHFGISHMQHGIMHVVVPELGIAQPGMLIVGCDSHTCTNGAMGALAFGFGASQTKHVLATQTVWYRQPRTMRIVVDDRLAKGVCAKDLSFAIIYHIGLSGGRGYAIEYAGNAVSELSMEARLTLCNMTIECGAQIGMISPDDSTFSYLKGRPNAPKGADWEPAVKFWKTLASDKDATFDTVVSMRGSDVEPMVTWGTSQDEACPVSGIIPDPRETTDAARRVRMEQALAYMDLLPGTRISDIKVNRVFIGSCTNSRLEDLREAARIVQGRRVKIPAIVVPGSMAVKRAAEAEGLDEYFINAGLEWRDSGCSMCTGANGDLVPAGERCVSTANRNMEGRQGRGSRTHLASPATAALAAVTGRLSDVREYI